VEKVSMAMPRLHVAAKRIVPGPHGSPVGGSQELGDAALLAGVADGDEAAFRLLVERHLSGLLVLARRMLRDAAEAEDVTQEALLRLWRSRGALEVGPYGLRPWLRRVVSNLCIDKMRSGRRLTVTDDVPEQAEPADQLTQVEERDASERVDTVVKALPDRQRMALTLFHYEGLSQIEVGRIMGVSDEAVESLLARARRRLKVALRDEWRELLVSDETQ
jgi:RNA polymerase sigma-70 factor (ECF subfamily)